jgi:TP901 family phage tail tape measure protein|nr:MAG TPA: minor tail protein [Caudoviricetes sp.]
MINSRSLVEVGVAMVLKDRFSNEAGRISNSFRTMMNDMNTWNRGIQMSAANAFDFGKELVGGMAKAYQYSAGVYDQVFLASKMSGANAAQQARLMQVAKEVNEVTPLTAKDIALGERYLAMAGNNVEQIEKMIGPAAKLASIFSMPVGEKGGVADLMTNIMQTFNIPSQNATQVVDQLATAVNSANISLTDLAQSFQYSGAEFRNAKISMGDAAAAIGVLGNQGIQASSAGTALANMMRYLTLSVTGQKKAGSTMLKSLGIDPASLVDSQGNLLRLDKIITMLGDKLRGRRGIDISSALFNIFGVRGTRAASALLQDYWSGTNKLTELMDKVNSAKGTVESLTQERLQTPAGIIEQFKSNWENFIVTAGSTLAEVFSPVLKLGSRILGIINSMQETWAGKFLVKVVATGAVIGTLYQGFKFIQGTIRMISTFQALATTETNGMAEGMARTNVQASILEGHLRNISAMMMRMTAMQMAPGKFFALPMGGTVGKTKKGTVVARDSQGRFTSMSTLAGAGAGAAVGSTVTRTAGQQVAKRGAIGFGARLLGSRLLGFLGGPLGLALSIGIPLLIEVIGGLTNSVDKNTEALNSDDNKASIQERNQQAFVEAVRSAIRDGFKDSRINISVDGEPVGDFAPGNSSDFTGIALGIN